MSGMSWLIVTVVGVIVLLMVALASYLEDRQEGRFLCPGCNVRKQAGEFDRGEWLCRACVALLDDPPEEQAEEEVSVEASLQILPTGEIRLIAPGTDADEVLDLNVPAAVLAGLKDWLVCLHDGWPEAPNLVPSPFLVTVRGRQIKFTLLSDPGIAFSFSLPAVGLLLAWIAYVKERA